MYSLPQLKGATEKQQQYAIRHRKRVKLNNYHTTFVYLVSLLDDPELIITCLVALK